MLMFSVALCVGVTALPSPNFEIVNDADFLDGCKFDCAHPVALPAKAPGISGLGASFLVVKCLCTDFVFTDRIVVEIAMTGTSKFPFEDDAGMYLKASVPTTSSAAVNLQGRDPKAPPEDLIAVIPTTVKEATSTAPHPDTGDWPEMMPCNSLHCPKFYDLIFEFNFCVCRRIHDDRDE